MRYGAFSLAAMQRILAARGRPKTPLDALADDHRTYLDGLLDEHPTPPRPTSDYQALLGEEPHDAEADRPRPRKTTPKAPTTRTTAATRGACMRTSPPRCGRWASRWLPAHARRGAVGGGEGIAQPPGVPASPAGRPAEARKQRPWSGGSARRSSAS